MGHHQSPSLSDSSLLCMHNIDEFQVVLKLELREGVVAHACSLHVLCATDPSMGFYYG